MNRVETSRGQHVCCPHLLLEPAICQHPEGPATGHLGTGFAWFPCVFKRMLGWFPVLQAATACFSCSPPRSNQNPPNLLVMYVKLPTDASPIAVNKFYVLYCLF